MPEDPDDHVAQMFHGLVSDLQRNDVARFEAEQKKERDARAALRHEIQNQGMNAAELLKKLDGDPAEDQRKMQDDLMKIERESQTAAAQNDKSQEPLPAGHFPPPPASE